MSLGLLVLSLGPGFRANVGSPGRCSVCHQLLEVGTVCTLPLSPHWNAGQEFFTLLNVVFDVEMERQTWLALVRSHSLCQPWFPPL